MQLKELFTQLCKKLEQAPVYIGHGVSAAEDEVVLLLMHVLDLDFEQLNQAAETEVSEEKINLSEQLLSERIIDNRPMAYVVGFSVFAGLRFEVDERVLIPRSPFVQLIDSAFQPWVDVENTQQVLDLCTGSGCIGLAMAHYFTNWQVTLSDLSADALEVAHKNRRNLSLNQVQLVQSDLFENIHQSFDLIVTNPPYVSDQEYQSLPAEFSHEPKMALVTEADGLATPVRILAQAAEYLTAGGFLFLEVGFYDQALTEALPDVDFIWLDFEFADESMGDGQGICVFSRDDLLKFKPHFDEF